MRSKLKVICISACSAVLFVFVGIYLLLSIYYKNGFSYGTWINGVYCTGKTIDEINCELKTKYETGSLIVTNPDGSVENIKPEDIEYSIDFTSYLQDIKDSQKSFFWIKNLFKEEQKSKISPDCSYNEELLKEKLMQLTFVKNNTHSETEKVEILKTENGFELYDNFYYHIDFDRTLNEVSKALFSSMSVTFDDQFLYRNDYTDKDLKIIEEWENYKNYFEMTVSIDFGAEKQILSHSTLSRFVSVGNDGFFIKDSDGNLLINDEEISDYADELCDMYDTYKDSRDFLTHSGEIKTIETVLYGTLIDHEIMKEKLVTAVHEGKSTVISPIYKKEAYVKGLNDIGPTYIEIDMGEQVLYFYKNGECVLETDIVSGKPSTPTPAMVTKICSKSRNVILRGTGYSCFVNYWVPIYPAMGIGLHDSSWQSTYGGDWYLKHGSHGCINMQKDAITYLYDEIEIGLPVIAYY